jgi:zinc protease
MSGPTTEQLTEPRAVPGLGKIRRAKLPTVAERVLPSGLRVVAVRRASVPIVHVRLRVPTAVRRDADLARAGMLEHTMLLGTAERSQSEIADALQRIGGSLRASSDADRLVLAGESLAPGLPDLLGLLAEVLTAASYPRAEVEREAVRLADLLGRRLSQPGVVADERWLRQVFGDHPYGREYPAPDEVLDVSASSLRSAHRRRLAPDGSLLVLVGDLSPARVLDRVEGALAGWSGVGSPTTVPEVTRFTPGALQLVDRPGAVQSNLRVGGFALPRTDPDHAAQELANAIFAGPFVSRLTQNIREDKGYTYSPHSAVRHLRGDSRLLTSADVATEVTAPAMVEVLYELGRIASLPPTPDELESTVQYLTGTLALGTATQAGLAETLVDLMSDGKGVDWLQEYPARLAATTPEDVQEAAASMLAPASLVSVVVGDADVVEPGLSMLMEVVRR